MVFQTSTKAGDALAPNACGINAVNNTGAAVVKGTFASFLPSTQQMRAVSTAAIAMRYPLAVALEDIASGATGKWSFCGEVYANVDSGVSSTDTLLMPTTAATGGTTLIAFATDAKGANKSCGINIAAGAGTTLTKVLFDGLSGRTGGFSEAS